MLKSPDHRQEFQFIIACIFFVSEKNRLDNPIGFNLTFGCSCERVAMRPFVLASVVITFR